MSDILSTVERGVRNKFIQAVTPQADRFIDLIYRSNRMGDILIPRICEIFLRRQK